MAAVVSHAMRRYQTSPSSSFSPQNIKGETSYPDSWSPTEVSESSLARSMKYAEPWLYGSMRAPAGLLLTPALVLCSCSEYLNGTKRSSKKNPTVCKKCRGTRLPISASDLRNSTKFGTVRCYPTVPPANCSPPSSRPETVRVSSHSRPSILPSADPYELMRRSRLSSDSSNNGSHIRPHVVSPTKDEKKTGSSKKSSSIQSSGTIGRRSILECSINPYDLISVELQSKSDIGPFGTHRIRAKLNGTNYENVQVDANKTPSQIPKLRSSGVSAKSKNVPSDMPKLSPKCNEKEIDSNRFKSILKKPTTFSDTDSSGGPERSPSPALKSGSHFYLPMPTNTPRKKVQFLVEKESITNGSERIRELNNKDEGVEVENFAQTALYDDVESLPDDTMFFSLRRTVSERNLQDFPKVTFYDTMALRSRSQKSNCKKSFGVLADLQRLDGLTYRTRSNSTPSLKQQSSPPPSVNLDSKSLLLHNHLKKNGQKPNEIQYAYEPVVDNTQSEKRGSSAPVTKANEYESIVSDNHKIPQNRDEAIYENVMKCIEQLNQVENDMSSKDKLQEQNDQDDLNLIPPPVPPRKRSNSKQPVSAQTFDSTNYAANVINENVSVPSFDRPNKTVVQIRSSSNVHKIQIRNELVETNNVQTVVVGDTAQRKTSIMINGDDCYSTVNVNDDVPLYQSSVVVKDSVMEKSTKSNRSSKIYITGNFTNTEINSDCKVSSKETKEFFLKDLNNSEELNADTLSKLFKHSYSTLECYKSIQPSTSNNIERDKTHINTILNDPVEAVKRNLVPHVCGKSDVHRRPPEMSEKIQVVNEIITEKNSTMKENSETETASTDIESNKSASDEDKDIYSENSSSTQYEMMDLGSDCYTDNSNRSSVTEDELGTRTKFYELLADSAIAELSESDDHHYESIKISNDPIYEEICPPPLPQNPPPISILDDLNLDKQFTTRSIFEGASKYDILSYLVDAKERGLVAEDTYNFGNSDVIIEEEAKIATDDFRSSHINSDSSEENSLVFTNTSIDDKKIPQKSAEVERNDSGVGSETSKSSLNRFRNKCELTFACEDCEVSLDPVPENEPLICRKCVKKRSERKEIITEIVETEEKYSRDLQIILEEFYQPMLVAGLLTPDQLSAIFLNVEELLENSQNLAERLRDAVEIALEQGDEDLLTVNIGKLFLEAAPMLHAFETYCVRQGNASLLLASLEKDKELLRIFLRVSQMENTMLRRMNLNSFLMVPVQRVTKYPLLLTRLYKTTPIHHENREQIKEAQHKVELHLNHMNSETKDIPSKLWRRIGNNSGRRSSSEMDLVSIKLRKIAVDVLEWNHEEAKFVFEGKLLFTQPTDNNWRKGRTIKLAPINALLVINGKQSNGNRIEDGGLTFPKTGVREAALLLIRDKNGRYSLLREPLYLDRCIIATDPSWQSYFEVQEVIGKDTFIFKAETDDLTRKWYRQLQYHAQGLGGWRKRRNALANIMINGMGLRS